MSLHLTQFVNLLTCFNFRKVLPCVNLFTEKLPEAIFKPVFNLDFFRDFSVETLRRLIQFFMCLWTSYNQQVKKRHLLGSSPIISDVEKCKEAIKQIKYLLHVARACVHLSISNVSHLPFYDSPQDLTGHEKLRLIVKG